MAARCASCYCRVTEVMGPSCNRGVDPLTVPGRVTIRERGIVLASSAVPYRAGDSGTFTGATERRRQRVLVAHWMPHGNPRAERTTHEATTRGRPL
jgi:hypothetical protein